MQVILQGLQLAFLIFCHCSQCNGNVPFGVEVFLPDSSAADSPVDLGKHYTIIKTTASPFRTNANREFGDLDEKAIQFRKTNTKASKKFGFSRASGSRRLLVDETLKRYNIRVSPRKVKKKLARCGEEYKMTGGQVIKLKYPKHYSESFCLVVIQAANAKTSLTFNCKKLNLQKCEKEYMFLSDGVNEGMFCRDENPGTVTDLKQVLIQYERNKERKYKGSKIACLITAKSVQGEEGEEEEEEVGGSTNPDEILGDQICKTSCGKAQSFTGANRIVGGAPASAGEYPWMVNLNFDINGQKGVGLCGGSILNSKTILTAAHCLAQGGLTGINVIAGEHDLTSSIEPNYQKIIGSSFIIHPNYQSSSQDQLHDIALVKLSSNIRFEFDVGPVCIAPAGDYANLNAIVTGWGTQRYQDSSTLVDVLHEVGVKVWDHDQCKKNYAMQGYDIISKQVCASADGKDSCQGDSGGPLVVRNGNVWYQIGLVSYGIDCAQEKYPGVYTKPIDYLPWIKDNMASGNCN